MNGIIRNFVGVKVICHFLITGIWIYWGIFVHPLTSGWLGWSTLIGGGILYFIGGGVCLIADHESDLSGDDPWWALGYSLINLLMLGYMMYYTGLYPNNPSFLTCPAVFAVTTLLLYGGNGFGSASLLVFVSVSLWLSNWGIDRWYDYCILIGVLLIAFISIIVSTFKLYKETVSDVRFWLINFGLCSLVNVGLLSILYYKGLFSINNSYNIVYITIGIFLFSLVVSTRGITIVLSLIAGVIYWWKNTEFTYSSLIPDLSFEWIHSNWFQVAAWIVGGLLVLGLIGYVIYKLIPPKIVYVDKYVDKYKEHKLPMMYHGLSMTCPFCRKTMVTGKYEQSTARGITKATAKGVIGGASVIGAFGAGAAVGGPFALLTGGLAALGAGALNYYNSKKIDVAIDSTLDLWNYEVDGGRTVHFKCPRPECGHEWTELEKYGEIEH